MSVDSTVLVGIAKLCKECLSKSAELFRREHKGQAYCVLLMSSSRDFCSECSISQVPVKETFGTKMYQECLYEKDSASVQLKELEEGLG